MDLRHVDVDGARIGYRRAGTGPPLVLLHGGLADSRSWRREIEAFAAEHDVVAWDAPGCGGSDDPPPGLGLEDYADRLAAFIETLRLDRPHVLGLSFGGGLGLSLAARHPDLPRTLVAASAYAGWGGSLPPDEVARRVAAAETACTDEPSAWLPDFLASLFSGEGPYEGATEIAEIAAQRRPAGARIMLRAFAEADLRPVLGRIRTPTLLLYGDADRRAPPPVARDLHARVPAAELTMLEGAGHLVHVEAPERFRAAVHRFLARHRA
jgi:pimeloyl-ACP methyl ester carboxylesterase